MRASLMMALAGTTAVALAAGGCTSDPCAGKAGSCLALTVKSSTVSEVDRFTLARDTGGERESKPAKALSLPAAFAVLFSPGEAGHVALHITGYLRGTPVGVGDAVTDLAEGAHGSATATLTNVSPDDIDMSDVGDMALPPNPDLNGFSCTAGAVVDCGNPSTLRTCGSDGKSLVNTSCPLGCGDTPMPHCKGFFPSGAVTNGDLNVAGTLDITIAANAALNTDDGTIDNVRGATGNSSVADLKGGVSYRIVNNVAIFNFSSLTVPTGVTFTLKGTHPVALVAAGDITIVGVIDARGYTGTTLCMGAPGGPGGGAGGATSTNGSGAGAGAKGTASGSYGSGGGGGGYGDVGGRGGNIMGANGGAFGVINGNVSIVPLVGGSGGGASTGGNGGGGGGAVQLVAGGKMSIGGGGAAGGVNAGGCGGIGGYFGTGGGGGGAGGAILVESPVVQILAKGVLAANGAGGGTGGGAQGTPGGLDAMRPTGSPAGSGTYGGYGGAGPAGQLAGLQGGDTTSQESGGGGGGVGRIRINNVSGTLTIDAAAIVSPNLMVNNSAGNPVSTVGTIDVH